jgi:hypothetical protein
MPTRSTRSSAAPKPADAYLAERLARLEARVRLFAKTTEGFPVLARLRAGLEEGVRASVAECLARQKADGIGTGRLVSLTPGLSDPHEGGRTVMRLDFSSGERWLYKPRGAAMEAAFARLALWPTPRFVDKGTHSWHEFVEPKPATDRELGALLAVMSYLRATDVHAENLVGSVPVDLEGLFGYEGDERWAPLATGLLPYFRYGGADALSEVSCGLAGRLRPCSYARWDIEKGRYEVPREKVARKPDSEEVLKGFRSAKLKFKALPPLETRHLVRSTLDYVEWQTLSTAVDCMRDEGAFERALDAFAFSEPEKAALRRHDVPIFRRTVTPKTAKGSEDAVRVALALPDFSLKLRAGRDPLKQAALAIGEGLAELALPGPAWLDLVRPSDKSRMLVMMVTDAGFYNGAEGIAFFFDALHRVTGKRPMKVPVPPPPKPQGSADVLNGDGFLILRLLREGRTEQARKVAGTLVDLPPVVGGGYGHGPAGTAALLYKTGYEKRARELMEEAKRRAEPGGFCRGSVGLGFGLLALGEELGDLDLSPLPRHHLCCGEAGRIMLLAKAGRKKEARAAALEILGFYKKQKALKLGAFLERPFLPGLFQGVAGVGLAFLAASSPEDVELF